MCHSHHSYGSSACPQSPGFEEVSSPHGQTPMFPKNDDLHFPDGKWNLKRMRDDQAAERCQVVDLEGGHPPRQSNNADDSGEATAATPHSGVKGVFSPPAARRDGSKASQGSGGARRTARVLFGANTPPEETVDGFLTSTERQVRTLPQAWNSSWN